MCIAWIASTSNLYGLQHGCLEMSKRQCLLSRVYIHSVLISIGFQIPTECLAQPLSSSSETILKRLPTTRRGANLFPGEAYCCCSRYAATLRLMLNSQTLKSLLELDHLTVSGDVTFGRGVQLRGTVIVVANELVVDQAATDSVRLTASYNTGAAKSILPMVPYWRTSSYRGIYLS